MKKALRLLLVIFTLSTLILLEPFSISADNVTLSSPFVGVNIHFLSTDHYGGQIDLGTLAITNSSNNVTVSGSMYCTVSNSNGYCDRYNLRNTNGTGSGLTIALPSQTIKNTTKGQITSETNSIVTEFEFVLDNYYVGSFDFTISNSLGLSDTDTLFVNGTTVTYTKIMNVSETDWSFTINNYDLNILDSNKIMWMYPIESYNIVSYGLNNLEQLGLYNQSNYIYPIFSLQKNSIMYRTYSVSGKDYVFVFALNQNIYNASIVSNFLSFTNFTLKEYNFINRFYTNATNNQFTYLYRFILTANNTDASSIKYIGNNNISTTYMPIYFNDINNQYISTDFALNYGLSNSLLNNLDIIANGTNQSNNTASNADNTNQTLGNKVNQEEDLVSDAEDTLSNDLNTLDITNKNNDLLFNQKFIKSAIWVRDRFNYMTNNNAYGYMITFAMVIGLALVIIGKLRG